MPVSQTLRWDPLSRVRQAFITRSPCVRYAFVTRLLHVCYTFVTPDIGSLIDRYWWMCPGTPPMWQSTDMCQQWWFLQLCLQEWLRSLWQFLLWSVAFHRRLLEVLRLKVFKIFLVYLAICVMVFRLFDVMPRVVCHNYNYKCFQLKEAHSKKLHELTQSVNESHWNTHERYTKRT